MRVREARRGGLVVGVGLASCVAVGWAERRWLPAVVSGLLATAVVPLLRAARGARGTALRSAVLWGALALALALVSQAAALTNSVGLGRIGPGFWIYASTLTTMAALISVLNARRPGEGAWAILMSLLVLVFLLIPWLEGSALARPVRDGVPWQLVAPWTYFYIALVLSGVTNYLPTRYGPAAGWLALGFGIEYLELTRGSTLAGLSESAFPATLALAYWTAGACAGHREAGRGSLEILWFWFRDHWGVVWALRIRERFNRSAEAQHWPIRLGWYGLVEVQDAGATPTKLLIVPKEAESTFLGLLGRFADRSLLEAVLKEFHMPGL